MAIGPLVTCLVAAACAVGLFGAIVCFRSHSAIAGRLLGAAILGFAGTLAVFLGFALFRIFGA